MVDEEEDSEFEVKIEEPYIFARDIRIELKIANDKREREQPKPSRSTRTVENSVWLRGIIRN